jgi:6-phosphogluconolactonase
VSIATPPEIHVLDDPASYVGSLLAEQATRGASIVLTGGSTPGPAYERAAELEPDWSGVTLWWTDERCVPPDDEQSNYGLVRETLIRRLEGRPGTVHRIRGEISPAQAADEYDQALAGAALDFVLLGLGADGHMASLFPDSPQLKVRDRRATHGPAGLEPFVERVTMTLPTLRSASRIVFLITGEGKADAVHAAFDGYVAPEVPASLIRLSQVPIEVYLDEAAAAKLERA